MNLPALISDYLNYRRALGLRLKDQAFMLHAFCKSVGSNSVAALTADQACAYIFQGAVSQETIVKRYRTLSAFYRYLASRRGIHLPPLPQAPKVGMSTFVPHIYSHEELGRLLAQRPSPAKIRRRFWMETRCARYCYFCMEQGCAWVKPSGSMSATSI